MKILIQMKMKLILICTGGGHWLGDRVWSSDQRAPGFLLYCICICICIEDQMNAHQFFFFMLITTISMMIIQWPILISYCCFCPSLVSTSGTRCLIFHLGDQCLLTNYLWVLNILNCLSLSFSTLQDLTGDAVKTETKKTVIKSKLREIMRTVGYLFIW